MAVQQQRQNQRAGFGNHRRNPDAGFPEQKGQQQERTDREQHTAPQRNTHRPVSYTHLSLLLTDRGSEFEKHSLFEVNNETGEIRSDIFYCDPQMPSQKPHRCV